MTYESENLGPLDHDVLKGAGVPTDSIGTLKGRFPLTYGNSSLPPGSLDRMATDYFELYAATRPATIYETSGSRKRTAFHYRLGYVAFSSPEARWSARWNSLIDGFSLYIQPGILAAVAAEVFGEPAEQLRWRHVLGDHVPAIAYLALDIGSQAVAGYPAGVKFVEDQVETLLAMLVRRYSSSEVRDTRLVGIHSPSVLRALEFINGHLKQAITVETIADAAAASPPHLNKLFRAELGVSVWAYVQSKRFDAIKEALQRAQSEPDKIARTYGYASIASVNKLYQRKNGVPLTYGTQSTGPSVS
ncbi:MAG: AraC family transcriptional regulator [Pseudomonadota bacterium]